MDDSRDDVQGESTAANGARTRRRLLIGAVVLMAALLAAYAILRHYTKADYIEQRLSSAVTEASDSLYRVALESADFNLLRRSLEVRNITLRPDSVVLQRRSEASDVPSVRYTITVPFIRLDGINPLWMLGPRGLKLRTVRIGNPLVHLTVDERTADSTAEDARSEDEAQTGGGAPPSLPVLLARRLPEVMIDQVVIDSASFSWGIRQGQENRRNNIEGIDLRLDEVVVDATAALDTSRVLFSRNVRVALDGYRHVSSDSLYLLELGPVRGSTQAGTFTIASFNWAPPFSDAAFLQRQPHRTERYKLDFGEISLRGVDYRGLLEGRGVFVGSVDADTPRVDVLYDRTLPEKPKAPAVLPHESFQKLELPLRIDTLRVRRGDIRYAEQAEDGVRPGSIRFGTVWGTVYNVTNDPQRMTSSTPMVVDGRARVAGAGQLNAKIEYQLLAKPLNLRYRGTLGRMDAKAFNEAFVDLEGVRITGGTIDSIWFDIDVDGGRASGGFEMRYRGLELEVLDKVTREQALGDRLKTFLVDHIVEPANQPQGENPAVVAIIQHERKPGDPLFKFMWDTLKSGIFTTLGI